ncbi:MAG: hypothetical protein ACK43J_06475 [Chitinophagaceae bacterium]|jgi:hypothetical protein
MMKVNNTPKVNNELRQSVFEIDSWIRLIEFLNQEIHHMQNRLTEITDSIHNSNHIDLIEHFNNMFIIKMDVLSHVLFELKKQKNKWNALNHSSDPINKRDLKKIQKNLRAQVEFIGKEQQVIQKDYYTFINSIVL